MSPRQPVRVSDHALLRLLERALGVDVEAMRADVQARLDPVVRVVGDGVFPLPDLPPPGSMPLPTGVPRAIVEGNVVKTIIVGASKARAAKRKAREGKRWIDAILMAVGLSLAFGGLRCEPVPKPTPVQSIKLPIIVQDYEGILSIPRPQYDQLLVDLRALGVGAIKACPLWLEKPFGDAPNAARVVSPFRVPNQPWSGIDPAREADLVSRARAWESLGGVWWWAIHEEEHDKGFLWTDRNWGDSASRAAYVNWVLDVLVGGRAAFTDWEECPRQTAYVAAWLRAIKARAPQVLAGVHNPNAWGAADALFGPLVGNDDLDLLSLQVAPADAAAWVRNWRARLADADHSALVIALESTPADVGIAPDRARDPAIVRQWIEEPIAEGASGFGIYAGYSWPEGNDLGAINPFAWAGFYAAAVPSVWPKWQWSEALVIAPGGIEP